MAYYVETAPAVLAYLQAVDGLSDESRTAIVDGYLDELGRDAEKFLALNPLGPESFHFRYDFSLLQENVIYEFRFIVDGTHMEAGVVRVVYVEYTSSKAPR